MRNKLLITTCVLLAFASTVAADIKPVADEATGRILEMKRRDGLIRGDAALFRVLLGPEVRYTHSTGLVQSKDDVVKMVENNHINYLSIDVEQEHYAIYVKSIVVTGTQTIRLKVDGKPVKSRSRFTVVYQIIRDKWKLIAYQSTPVPEEEETD